MTMISTKPIGDDRSIPKAALLLGIGGLIPLLGLAGLICADLAYTGRVWASFLVPLLIGYGAIVLSFLGGVRWGLALRDPSSAERKRFLTASVAPPFIAWLALAMSPPIGLAFLAAAFVVVGWLDWQLARQGATPLWYGTLRIALTVVVVIVLAAMALLLFSSSMGA